MNAGDLGHGDAAALLGELLALASPCLFLAAGPAFAQESARGEALAAFERAGAFAPPRWAPAPRPLGEAAAPQPPRLCSGLDFSGVVWPPSLTQEDRLAIQLALNITGSYEGPDGWSNLTGNFDGQGVSVGLLNQNLGQGSLQPLLIRLRDSHPEALSRIFSPEDLQSLLAMLARWEAAPAEQKETSGSRLDQPDGAALSPANAASVEWAKKTLYKDGKFKPGWKAGLMALGAAPEYVSIQIDAALYLHERALDYQRQINIRELRAYLMLFDVAVQNGSLYPEDLADYAAWRRANPRAASTQALEKLLELRLRHVRKRFVADVRSRKRAIIRGKGVVHGESRDLPAQYCYDALWPYQ